jgi:hypothetical protein
VVGQVRGQEDRRGYSRRDHQPPVPVDLEPLDRPVPKHEKQNTRCVQTGIERRKIADPKHAVILSEAKDLLFR